MKVPYDQGNAEEAQHQIPRRGWFVGSFIRCPAGLHENDHVEVKWGMHSADDQRTEPSAYEEATTLTILVTGKFEVGFPGFDAITLARRGDYVIYGPGVSHTWRAIEDAVVVTIRWPSVNSTPEYDLDPKM